MEKLLTVMAFSFILTILVGGMINMLGRGDKLARKFLFILGAAIVLMPIGYMKIANTYNDTAAFGLKIIAAIWLLAFLFDVLIDLTDDGS